MQLLAALAVIGGQLTSVFGVIAYRVEACLSMATERLFVTFSPWLYGECRRSKTPHRHRECQ